MKERIRAIVTHQNYKPLSPGALVKKLGKGTDLARVQWALDSLAEEGVILFTKKGKIARPADKGMRRGIFSYSGRGFGFVSENGDRVDESFVPPGARGGAMHGDTVLYRTEKSKSGDRLPEARIVSVLERAVSELTATLTPLQNRKDLAAVPDNNKLGDLYYLSQKSTAGMKAGDKVRLAITEYPTGKKPPKGWVVENYGPANSLDANYQSILYDHDIPTEFPQDVLAAAAALPQTIGETQGRLDLRDKIIFTIDGADTKDIDDAISVDRLADGRYELGVHIADVSHYVPENSPIDREAYKRGTSIYFTDKVVPMLPKELSNGICSLNPGVDRYALSAFMTIDAEGRIAETRFARTVIRSRLQGVYEEINRIYDGTAPREILDKYAPVLESLHQMRELAAASDRYRHSRGNIDFAIPEACVRLNDAGEPVDILLRERGIAHRMIETFMLAANESVAKFIRGKDKPCVYRVHEDPAEEKVENFKRIIAALGYSLEKGEVTSLTMQHLLEKVKGTPYELMISNLMLRSMMKARYSPACTGHFGLAAPYYCHFTAPIRRYPDLTVHRILKLILDGRMNEKNTRKWVGATADIAEQSSETEVRAVEAERDIEDLYKVLYMVPKVGETFDGVISSVTSFGCFVQLPNTIEGLVRISDLTDDYYEYDEDRMRLRGTRTGKIYSIGQAVRVILVKADIVTRQIDFMPDCMKPDSSNVKFRP